jgi:hypothetical protein
MERLNIFVAVFDGNTITKANSFYLVSLEPLSALSTN